MHRVCRTHCNLALLLILLAQALASSVYAQDAARGPARPTLAQRTLAGPIATLGVGGALLVAAPVIFGLGALSTLDLEGCDTIFSPEDEQDCTRQERLRERREDRIMKYVTGISISSAILGAGLVAFGVTRIVQIRRARRQLRGLQRARLHANRHGATFTLRFSF